MWWRLPSNGSHSHPPSSKFSLILEMQSRLEVQILKGNNSDPGETKTRYF